MVFMPTATLTLKLPFLDLNKVKMAAWDELTALNTQVANGILEMPREESKKLTTKAYSDVRLGSAWMNQTIRNANAKTKVKRLKVLPLETNNQNWTLHKVGDTYSLGFGLLRGVKKRVPLKVHQSKHSNVLERILKGEAKQGSLKLVKSKRGVWYALVSVSWEVPEAKEKVLCETGTTRFVGVDRGQNHLAVAATPEGTPLFLSFRRVRQVRRHYASKRRRLQKAGKHKTVKQLEQKETRTIRHINHIIAKELVLFAQKHGCGICFEDLSDIRQSKQRKTTKRDAGQNRDYWPYFDLEQKAKYKAILAGVAFEKVPAAYTSKSCCKCGALGKRERHNFKCERCGYRGHADHNASVNIGKWLGLSCPLVLEVPTGGVHGTPLSSVTESGPSGSL